ncbi:RNA polymerase sigma factor [Clostridium fungisolvens]|uniref:ECF RNA polymerase sigma factor SigW n=1 Tax=Clostridium fungisolvens TaxID=1604897 RepID=A0A6V8SDU5_9CLOT|nr:RNA polymerase sigma factor [Clostridium fungisolvens]GFP75397.1 ECF RNA polymerase sigma factor SigW [Clostridium fungisolvens]
MQNPSKQLTDNFSQKYKLYSDMLFKICMIYLGNKEDAEEAVQESFLKLIYKSPQFNNNEHEKAWLIRVTINICKDILRSIWRKRVINLEDIERYYDSSKEIEIMEEIIRLPSKYKDVIYLYYFEDYSIKDISRILNISESAVKMRLKRGRDALKIELEGEEL